MTANITDGVLVDRDYEQVRRNLHVYEMASVIQYDVVSISEIGSQSNLQTARMRNPCNLMMSTAQR